AASQLRVEQRLETRAVSLHLAHAAVQYARLERRHLDETPYDTLGELGAVHRQELGRGAFEYTMVDEGSRIHLNKAPQEVLARITGLGLDGAVAVTDSTLRPFHWKEELLLIEGITEEMFRQAQSELTTFGNGQVNLNTAEPSVLKALSFDTELIELIAEYRAGQDGHPDTADDGVLKEPGTLLGDLRAFRALSARQETLLTRLTNEGLLGTRSPVVRLQVQTSVLGRLASRYSVLLETATGKVIQWSEE
ncbi:MAG: general secretion pathway protein GspK, partial [Candidatus Omnitrophica bacterium]|nr:general secretion pathway protein GspK [Candidatus Omnitrophota bacterium]